METKPALAAADESVAHDIAAVLADADRLIAEGNSRDARAMLEHARSNTQAAGNLADEARVLRVLANAEYAAGQYEPARDLYEVTQLALHQLQDAGEADVLLSLGDTQRKLRKVAEARDAYRTAARLFAESNDPLGRAQAEFKLGQTTIGSNPGLALEHFTRAATFYDTADKLVPGSGLRLENPPLPSKVDDCRQLEPYVMAKLAQRETQRLRTLQEQATKKLVADDASPRAETVPTQRRRDLMIAGILFGGVTLACVGVVLIAIMKPALTIPVARLACGSLALLAAAAAAFGARAFDIQSRTLASAGPIVVFALVFGLSTFAVQGSTRRGLEGINLDELTAAPSDPAQLAQSLLQLGTRAQTSHIDAQARDAYAQALALYQQLGDRHGQAQVLRAQGDLFRAQNGQLQAVQVYAQALTFYRALNDRPQAAATLLTIGETRRALHQLSRARESYGEAVTIYGELKDTTGQARALRQLGNVESALGHWEAARRAYTQALTLAQQQNDNDAVFSLLLRLAKSHAALAQEAIARKDLASAMTMATQEQNIGRQARVWRATANLEAAVGHAQAARAGYEHALALYQESQAPRGQVAVLRGMGDLERSGGRQDAARELYTRALTIAKAETLPRDEARTLLRIAGLDNGRKDIDSARARFAEALTLYEQLGDTSGKAQASAGLGDSEAAQGRISEADATYTRALAYYRTVDDARGQIAVLEKLSALTKRTDPKRAKEYAERAAALARQAQGAAAAPANG